MANDLDEAGRLFAEAESFADEEADDEALALFLGAWDALPEPREEQEPAVRILTAIADCHFHLGEWDACREAVQNAFRCGADVANPFLQLRLGQALFELDDEQKAESWLAAAYLSEGRALFEDEDPKYLESFHGNLLPPPGGWPDGW